MKRNGLIALAAALLAAGCATKTLSTGHVGNGSTWTAEKYLAASREAAQASLSADTRGAAKEAAERGVQYANSCLEMIPEKAGCYYWRAVNTGLFYKVRIIGYQSGIKQMIEDANQVIALDPRYDQAGAYRMLGQIYTQLPQTGAHAESVTRDLALAEKYLRKAVRLAPDYPENRLSLAETLFSEEKVAQAIEELAAARELAPHWKSDISYDEWQVNALALEKKINKATD